MQTAAASSTFHPACLRTLHHAYLPASLPTLHMPPCSLSPPQPCAVAECVHRPAQGHRAGPGGCGLPHGALPQGAGGRGEAVTGELLGVLQVAGSNLPDPSRASTLCCTATCAPCHELSSPRGSAPTLRCAGRAAAASQGRDQAPGRLVHDLLRAHPGGAAAGQQCGFDTTLQGAVGLCPRPFMRVCMQPPHTTTAVARAIRSARLLPSLYVPPCRA